MYAFGHRCAPEHCLTAGTANDSFRRDDRGRQGSECLSALALAYSHQKKTAKVSSEPGDHGEVLINAEGERYIKVSWS